MCKLLEYNFKKLNPNKMTGLPWKRSKHEDELGSKDDLWIIFHPIPPFSIIWDHFWTWNILGKKTRAYIRDFMRYWHKRCLALPLKIPSCTGLRPARAGTRVLSGLGLQGSCCHGFSVSWCSHRLLIMESYFFRSCLDSSIFSYSPHKILDSS